jgi:type IV pilus assembly protein PilM
VAIWDKFKLQTGPSGKRPPTAIEIASEGVLAAAIPSLGAAPVIAFAPLPAGAIVPGVAEANLRGPEAVADAMRSALDAVSPRLNSVSVVIPDLAARVFVLDFDSLPAKAADVLPVLRFRLRKVVPFDVEQATLSYQVLVQERSSVKVLVVILPSAILAEYEGAVRAAGYEAGAILPAGLAALAAMDNNEPVLAAHLGAASLTTAIARGNDLMLYRTIELPDEPDARLAEVQRGVAVSAAYFEDRIGVRPEQLHYAGSVNAVAFAQAVVESQLLVKEIAVAPTTGAVTTMGPMGFAGVAGSLAGAA